ncbi:unnamed protein product [Cyprideis torosa]|uniref:Uncharacterized protein n=1 Tax=Cyprideis torosa TaxID=163714 RepID=A0A7R8W062_9CRUS|nr:unnamed protein product [Cyprideis torosa]CAG0879402.1 unnamed protein product [Cyprideis torosa]
MPSRTIHYQRKSSAAQHLIQTPSSVDMQHYIFVIQAVDRGEPSLSSTVTVYFNVQDLNDNAPVFDPMSYSDEVFENVTVGSSVLTVSATDQDGGANGRVTYSIVDGDEDGLFDIDDNGVVVTVKELDREKQSIHNLWIQASDLAEPPSRRLSSTIQATVILRDTNDNAPEFLSPPEAMVMENAPPNTVIMAVKALDRDEGANSYIEYSLAPVIGNKLVIGPVDGLIRVGGSIDREVQSSFSLLVTARDRGSPSRSATQTIKVQILDENDNAPVFDPRHYSATVSENSALGLSVLQAITGAAGRVRRVDQRVVSAPTCWLASVVAWSITSDEELALLSSPLYVVAEMRVGSVYSARSISAETMASYATIPPLGWV